MYETMHEFTILGAGRVALARDMMTGEYAVFDYAPDSAPDVSEWESYSDAFDIFAGRVRGMLRLRGAMLAH